MEIWMEVFSELLSSGLPILMPMDYLFKRMVPCFRLGRAFCFRYLGSVAWLARWTSTLCYFQTLLSSKRSLDLIVLLIIAQPISELLFSRINQLCFLLVWFWSARLRWSWSLPAIFVCFQKTEGLWYHTRVMLWWSFMRNSILFIVWSYDGFEALLAGCVPDHCFYYCWSDCEDLRTELYSQGRFVVVCKFIVDES